MMIGAGTTGNRAIMLLSQARVAYSQIIGKINIFCNNNNYNIVKNRHK